MQVTVSYRPRRRPDHVVDLAAGATVEDLMHATGQPVVGTLAVRDGVPVPEDTPLRDGDTLLLLSSFSGG